MPLRQFARHRTGAQLEAVQYDGPRQVTTEDVPDAEIERPTDALGMTPLLGAALLVRPEVQPGKEDEVADVSREGLAVVQDVMWFAARGRRSASSDEFPYDAARQTHLNASWGMS